MKFKSNPVLKLITLCIIASLYTSAEQPAQTATTDPPTDATNPTTPTTPTTPTNTTTTPVSAPSDPSYKPITCNKDVVHILGINGVEPLEKSLKHGFPACPRVKNACCNPNDAEKFLLHWEKVGQHRLKKALPKQRDVYSQLLDRMIKVSDKAKTVYSRLIEEPDNECKILSRTILTLRIGRIIKFIKSSMEQCHDSLQRAFKGIYCSICDADYHSLINPSSKEFSLSYQDCRELTAGCHKFLLYMHAHIPEILNLLSDFTTQCTDDGTFTVLKISEDVLFTRADEIAKKLEEARDNRNSDDWAKYFTPICGEFKIGEMAAYFMPNIDKFNNYNKHIDKALSGELQAQAKAAANPAAAAGTTADPAAPAVPPTPPTPPARLLSTPAPATNAGSDSSSSGSDDIDFLKPFKIFNGDTKKNLPIDEMKTVVKEPGIDIYFVTNRSLLTADELAAAKQMSKKATPAPTAEVKKDGETSAEVKSRRLRRIKSKKHMKRARKSYRKSSRGGKRHRKLRL